MESHFPASGVESNALRSQQPPYTTIERFRQVPPAAPLVIHEPGRYAAYDSHTRAAKQNAPRPERRLAFPLDRLPVHGGHRDARLARRALQAPPAAQPNPGGDMAERLQLSDRYPGPALPDLGSGLDMASTWQLPKPLRRWPNAPSSGSHSAIPRSVSGRSMYQDLATIVVANLASFLIGLWLFRLALGPPGTP